MDREMWSPECKDLFREDGLEELGCLPRNQLLEHVPKVGLPYTYREEVDVAEEVVVVRFEREEVEVLRVVESLLRSQVPDEVLDRERPLGRVERRKEWTDHLLVLDNLHGEAVECHV